MKKWGKTYSSAALGALLLASNLIMPNVSAAVSSANDVQGHWAEQQINSWLENEMAKGYADGSFKPNKTITRAEFMTLANQALGYTETKYINFSDVNAEQWFYTEVQKAHAAGYITGYQDGTIRPNQQVTRQEVAVMLAKMLNTEASPDNSKVFSDFSAMPEWSKDLIGAVAAKGYMNGYPDQTFKPHRPITRAEAISTLDRLIKEKGSTNNEETGTNSSGNEQNQAVKEVIDVVTTPSTGSGRGSTPPAETPKTPEATIPEVTFDVPGAAERLNDTTFNVSKASERLTLVVNVDVESKVQILRIDNVNGENILPIIAAFKPSLSEVRTVPAGSKEYQMSSNGMSVSTISSIVGGVMDVTLKMTNAKDESKSKEIKVRINLVD